MNKRLIEAIHKKTIKAAQGYRVTINGKRYDLPEIVKRFNALKRAAEDFRMDTNVALSMYLSYKMSLVPAISTSPELNPACVELAKNPLNICHKCFSMNCKHKVARTNREQNTRILAEKAVPAPDLQNYPVFRIEWGADVQNETQVLNYINWAKENPNTRFGWWSKHPGLICRCFKKYGKPENVKFIVSSLRVGVPAKLAPEWVQYVDHVFTVWNTAEEAAAAGFPINCGKRACIACNKCYSDNGPLYINELLK